MSTYVNQINAEEKFAVTGQSRFLLCASVPLWLEAPSKRPKAPPFQHFNAQPSAISTFQPAILKKPRHFNISANVFLLAVLALLAATFDLQATPANKSAFARHYGSFLKADLNRCTTCHLPSANRAPESLEDFPHNPFGDRLRSVARQSNDREISTRIALIGNEDSDKDGVKNEAELLLGHNPGDPKDKPGADELSGLKKTNAEFQKFLASYQWRPFVKVTAPAAPRKTKWARNEIDAFIAAEHKMRGLQPCPEASKEILLRRVYLDLIGLSPTPAEQEAFLADTSKDAYEKVVDRLLKDKRYGERWGRHWLDIWRYSDWAGWSGGNQIRDSKPHIWRWRDWTIEALNDDKPYDQMIREMLAADEFAPNNTNALRATGFLARNYKMLSREQWLEDTVKHTSQAFLGVTIGCAKCHDHMTDPISQKEYYQFRAIFEPHQVRTDRLPGETDIAKDGLVRVYDVGTNAPTYFFLRGDERKPDTNRVIRPGVPRALRGEFEVTPVILPVTAAKPDKRAFVIHDLIRESETAVKAAKDKDELATKIAEVKHASLLAVLKAEELEDQGKKDSTAWTEAAKLAMKRQRELEALELKAKLNKAEKDEKDAESKLETKPDDDAAKKKVESTKKERSELADKLAAAEKSAAEEPTTKYTPRKVDSYPEVSGGRRLGLAEWIANSENPLTARVAVNHIWLRHFGRGLVSTPADFGASGATPSHPALLDWLASQLMGRTGASPSQPWTMKKIHRLILTSATYRMASTPDERNLTADPDNVYLWRMPSRRMEGELVRDNLLYVAGSLDAAMGGPDIDHAQGLTSKRRSIYLRIAAEKEVEFLKIFDGPNVTECYMRRPTVVPQQALALANSEIGFKQARALAEKLNGLSTDECINTAYRTVLARTPNAEEKRLCREFLEVEERKSNAQRARQNIALVLFNHNDFVTIR